MGLKDLFTKEGRRDRNIRKCIDKAKNKKIKPDDRGPALYTLYEEAVAWIDAIRAVENAPDDGDACSRLEEQKVYGEMCVAGMLSRLTFIYDTNMVRDEEEKDNVYEWLVGLGLPILPVVRKHLRSASTLSWGLRLVTEVSDHETTWEVLSEVLEDFDPEYERDPSRKIQLMTFLGDFKDPRAAEAMLPFLEDQDETVRYVVADSLFKHGDELARVKLLELLTNDEEESLRIKASIVEGFEKAGWRVKGFKGKVEKLLANQLPDYSLDGKGHIKLKKARK